MAKICVIITTYNRKQKLYELLKDIAECAGFPEQPHDVDLRIYDDASKPNYADKYLYFKFRRNNGKKGYWRVINKAFNDVKDSDYQYYIQLPDDCRLDEGFFDKAIGQWNRIDDPQKACLNLLLDKGREGKPCWTNYTPEKVLFDKFEVWKTQWMDLCYICDHSMFADLQYSIKPIGQERWRFDENLGSGVGTQVSQRLHKMGKTMYQVTKTLVKHGDHESKMNPEARKTTKIIS